MHCGRIPAVWFHIISSAKYMGVDDKIDTDVDTNADTDIGTHADRDVDTDIGAYIQM